MNHTLFSILAPFALCAGAPAAQIQETYDDPTAGLPMPLPGGVEEGVPARLGSWFPSPGTPDGVDPASDEELAARVAAGVEFTAAPPMNSMIHHDGDETGMWVRARSYKAKASAAGFEYTPFLGSSAPRNFPVHFRLDRALLGERELPLNSAATVSRTGDRFVLDRGSVEVIYDLALDTVEQSFALDVAGASADLVLEIDVETDLAFEAGADGGFRFASELGGMSYGTAIVLDGAGRRADVPATFDGAEIQLTVPGAFLSQAQGEVIVDPILGTFTVANYAGDQERPDVAYDRNTDTFIHVYEDTFSGNDGDVFFRRWDSAGTYVDQGYVDSSTDNWRLPSVANIDFLNRSLIACERIAAGSNEIEIVGRFFRYSVLALEPILVIADPSPSWSNTGPDVGGSWAPSSDGVFVVTWRRDFGTNSQLRYRVVRANSTLEPIQFINLPSGLSALDPKISKSSGNPTQVNAWNVAFRVEDSNTNTEGVWNMQIAADGSVLTPPQELFGYPTGTTVREIDVSEGLALRGLAPTYLVTYDLFTGSTVEDKPIIVCRGGLRERIVQLSSLEHSFQTGIDATGIRFGATATDFLVSYLERRNTAGHMAYVTALDLLPFDNLGVSERRTLLGQVDNTFVRGAASIASRQSGGLNSAWSQVNWSGLNASGEWDVRAARHVASNGTTPALPYCTSAPNSTGDYGFLTMYGDDLLTSNKTLVATFLPSNSVGFFVTGNGFSVLTNPGGSVGNLCVAGGSILGRYSSFAASSGPQGFLTLNINPLALAAPSGTVAATAGS
ncbi:MAG: hypothetical protein AAGG01_17530, partial [Planctomycetota bacterium]